MLKSWFSNRQRYEKSQKGQVIILAAAAIIGIIAIVGLVIDGGMMFIQDGRLRRAIDAAAISAALQYRADANADQMKAEAKQFLIANGINDPSVTITICNHSYGAFDPVNLISPGVSVCVSSTGQPVKLVYVAASEQVDLAFLPVIGINHVTISSNATSQAASVDVVLVLDRSESMTFQANFHDPMRDPYYCNGILSPEGNAGDCEPFNTIKNDAIYFVQKLYGGFDRVSIVTFDKHAHVNMPLAYDLSAVENEIRNLSVVYGYDLDTGDNFSSANVGNICWTGNPCRFYSGSPSDSSTYVYFGCPEMQGGGTVGDCTTTNIGEGLFQGVNQFKSPSAVGGTRDDAIWVIIMLTDGGVNSAYDVNTGNPLCPGGPDDTNAPFTPNYWWHSSPGCRPSDVLPTDPRHSFSSDIADYTPYDYALDAADYINATKKIYTFTIGVGPDVSGNASATALLNYVATQGRGNSYILPDVNGLHQIFLDIANNIATKLSQ